MEKAKKELTGKQEAFCQAMADGMTQADAYRKAYDAEKMKPETIQNKAYELMQHGDIKARVRELQGKLEAKALWSREQSIETIKRGLETAEANNKPMEIFKGVEVLNKMLGYDAPSKLEVEHKESKLSDDELRALARGKGWLNGRTKE